MTRKDYNLISGAIRTVTDLEGHDVNTARAIVQALCAALGDADPKFTAGLHHGFKFDAVGSIDLSGVNYRQRLIDRADPGANIGSEVEGEA